MLRNFRFWPLVVLGILALVVTSGAVWANTSNSEGEVAEENWHGKKGPRGRRGMAHDEDAAKPMVEVLADLLDMTPEEMRDKRADGTSLVEMAQEAGVETEELVAAMKEIVEQRLDAAVDDGRLTQGEADEKLETIETAIEERLKNGEPLGMRDRRGQGKGNCHRQEDDPQGE